MTLISSMQSGSLTIFRKRRREQDPMAVRERYDSGKRPAGYQTCRPFDDLKAGSAGHSLVQEGLPSGDLDYTAREVQVGGRGYAVSPHGRILIDLYSTPRLGQRPGRLQRLVDFEHAIHNAEVADQRVERSDRRGEVKLCTARVRHRPARGYRSDVVHGTRDRNRQRSINRVGPNVSSVLERAGPVDGEVPGNGRRGV